MTDSLQATSFEELHRIHLANYNVGFMDVSSIEPESNKHYLEENFDKLPRIFKCIVEKENFEETLNQLNELFYILDDCEEKTSLINYIKTLTANFADVSDAPEFGVSVEKVTSDMCKYFHCDMNHLRLVYPLLGPGTLWVKEDNVRRQYLGKGQNDQAIIDQQNIFQVPLKTITLLKGQGHPTAHGKAIVHASPNFSEKKEKRVLLRIESMF